MSEAVEISVNGRKYHFFPGESFHNVERAYFLGILFANPLPRGIVTSGYGIRKSPFTGHNTFHNGIDLAAPAGTVVYAAREGKVTATGYNSTYGKYIIISHDGGYETIYGHLNKIFVELHDEVNSTMIIAEVGSTGLSTGPHLHFEVRKDGKSKESVQTDTRVGIMKRLVPVFIIIFSLFALISAAGDNIRGDVVKHVVLSDTSEPGEYTFSMNIEDVFAVSFDKESSFIRGFEIEVKVPSSLRNYSGSFAFIIYKQISPEVTSGIGTYYGRKYNSFIMPEAAKFYMQIPYNERLSAERAPYTTIFSDVLKYSDSPLMVTVLPMMKGFPSSLYSSSLTVRISPILKDSGNLSVIFDIPENLDSRQLEFRVDGGRTGVSNNRANIALSAGTHSLEVEIPGGRQINRTVTIRAGETANLAIEIEELKSLATIDVPENTIVYMDGLRLENTSEGPIPIAPGEHTVLFKIGDYKISKKFDILPGKDCKISLFLDIFIEEN